MRKLKVVVGFVLLFLLANIPQSNMEAHPGRTDGNGCHTCRTNCEKWGLKYGEYHCHNGGSTNDTQQSSGNNNTYVAPQPQVEQPSVDYETIGKNDGYAFKKDHPNATLEEATYTYQDASYKSSFEEAFHSAEAELEQTSKTAAINAGTKDATSYDTYQLDSISNEYMKSVYETNYKTAFDTEVGRIKRELDATAKEYAYASVFGIQKNETMQGYELEKYKEHYKKSFEKYEEDYKTEKQEVLEEAKKKGKEDKQETNDKNYDFLVSYENTKFYDEAKEAYDQAYENETTSPFVIIIGLGIWLLLLIVAIRIAMKRTKRYRRSLHTNG
ncbi:MAG: YHYH domain-containing protein [Longicatena sp.]